MKEKQKNILTAIIIILITALVIYILPLIPGFLKDKPDIIGFDQISLVLTFLLFNLIFIGIPAWFHWNYVHDYSKIKNVWFFALFGGITGALLGEGGNVVMILPYTVLMFIYAFFYKKFTWWKVALTSYLGGIIIENVINQSPIQAPTLVWIAFFIYPYFITKIWENRKKLSFMPIIKDFKYVITSSIVLAGLATYFSRNNISPPLIIFGITLPFLIKIVYSLFKRK